MNFYSDSFKDAEKDFLFVLASFCVGMYFLIACAMTSVDMKERVDSELAANKLNETATDLLKHLKESDVQDSEQKDVVAKFSRSISASSSNHALGSVRLPSFLHRKNSKTTSSFNSSGIISRELRDAVVADGGEVEMVQLTEIQATLNGTALKQWASSGLVDLKTYGKLKDLDLLLADAVSDQSPTSQFSLLPEASFYRELDRAFPFLLEWIENAESEQISSLSRCLNSMLEQSTRIQQHHDLIVDRDRSSVIYWLLQSADENQRKKFFHVMNSILRAQPKTAERRQYSQDQGRVAPLPESLGNSIGEFDQGENGHQNHEQTQQEPAPAEQEMEE